jgi:haloalkane dehalogenase
MDTLRTPEASFDDLEGYPFAPHYAEVDSGDGDRLRIHYIDEGAGPVVLLMHGQPSWSYLYRKVMPILVEAGFRVIAPDLVGFGRSDKPAAQSDYTYARHVSWMTQWLEGLGLNGVTMFCQDWGGLIGLRLVAAMPERFAAVVAANTGLPTGDQEMPEAFHAWAKWCATTPELNVGFVVQAATTTELSEAVVAGYNAPYPDETFQAGARVFPSLVPARSDDPEAQAQREAWKALMSFDKPFLTAFSDTDPITGGGDKVFVKLVPGAAGMPHRTIENGGHFLQEDQPAAVAQAVVDVYAAVGERNA